VRPLTYLKFLLLRPRFAWPTILHLIDVFRIRGSVQATKLPPCDLADQEAVFFQHRAGWLIDHIRAHGVKSAINRYASTIANPALLEDAYSASQRIVKLTYLHLLVGKAALPQALIKRARRDASIVVRHYEFRTNNTWFNNHLLNNYRSLILYASYFMDESDSREVDAAIHTIGAILEANITTLFESPGEPVLCEGSVSYEIYGLKVLAEIAACPYRTPLADTFRRWMVTRGKEVLMKYRYEDSWLVPQIGDIAPNWTNQTMIDFMDGFAFRTKDSVYRTIWSSEFSRIGI
jgi:hypothetical protein